ncbi:MAG TPA: ABC transporter substrate-binding protein [Chloroflexota bacterium]|nr:ABC transporter substrate-binding protein [Chloroflexota bacterium]
MTRFLKLGWPAGLIGVAVLLASCASPSSAPTATQAPATAKPTVASAAAGASSQAYQPTPLSPPVKISVGVLGSSSDGGIFIANDRGYFKDEGIDLDVQRFQSLVDMVAPLTGGQLQIAAGGLAASLYNASDRGISLRIVADKGQAPSAEWDFAALVIRKDLIDSGKVKDYKDLKGLTLVTSGRGNSPEVALATALKKGGLALADVNYTQMGFPDMVTALGSKGIDGGILIEPFVSRTVSEGTGVRWKGNVEIFGGNEQIAAIVYGEQFAMKPDVAQHWMNAYIRGVRDYNDAFGPKKKGFDDVVNLLVAQTTVKDPKIFAQMKPAGLDPDGRLDLQSMKADLAYYVESGQTKTGTDLSKLIDTSFQEASVKALGPYTP